MLRMLLMTGTVLFSLVSLPRSSAWAGDWDLNLARLCSIGTDQGNLLDCGGGYNPQVHGQVVDVFPHNIAFRSLMSELGVVFAPNILSPSDTQGYAGFSTSVELGWTMINPKKTADGFRIASNDSRFNNRPIPNLAYWRAANSVSSKVFESGYISPASASVARDRMYKELPSSFAPTVTAMVRKGLWLPVPSFELGVGIRHLIGSRMWAPLVMAKLALHEGFQGLPLPALAIRGTGVRVVGTPGFNLSLGGLDFSISKHIGIASTFNLTPYVGYQFLWIIADSEVQDATPGVDAMAETAQNVGYDAESMNRCNVGDCVANFTFDDQANITRHRVFFGLRFNFYISSLLLEYSLFASGRESDEIVNKAGFMLEIPDNAGTQHNISFSITLDY